MLRGIASGHRIQLFLCMCVCFRSMLAAFVRVPATVIEYDFVIFDEVKARLEDALYFYITISVRDTDTFHT
jgi:hypothetical protein